MMLWALALAAAAASAAAGAGIEAYSSIDGMPWLAQSIQDFARSGDSLPAPSLRHRGLLGAQDDTTDLTAGVDGGADAEMELRRGRRLLGAANPPTQVPPSQLCAFQIGDWCTAFGSQTPVPFKAAPRGNISCPSNCNQLGNCDYDTGRCYCSAGHGGDDCSAPRKRPCHRMGPDKLDAGWTSEPQEWAHTRCTGICDDNYAQCFCPPNTKFGHIAAPEGAPVGTPPIQQGRSMYQCFANATATGEKLKWAPPHASWGYDQLYGVDGWCNADQPKQENRCHCQLDGMTGPLCNIPLEHMCPNQCTARGQCVLGFCKCYDGWYGNDCSRKRAGLPLEQDDILNRRKLYLAPVVTPVAAALDASAAPPTRKLPLVYVYDIGSEFMTDLLQWRGYRSVCQYRQFDGRNNSFLAFYSYSLEPVLHELFLTTHHRTFDPEEADYFYVPHYGTCMSDFYGNNRIPMWPPGVHGPRPMGMANMLAAAQKWVAEKYPYFNRSGGADHVWLMAHDEGACYAPMHIWPGVILSPWGRMDMPHSHQTAYGPDFYGKELITGSQPNGWLNYTSAAHPCYDPVKDLVLPVFKDPHHYDETVYFGAPQPKRNVLFFFRGDMGEGKQEAEQGCLYSRCIRQRLLNLSKTQEWDKHDVLYGRNIPGRYSDLLLRSIFCLVLPGDGWSGRFPDSLLHGCIPVIIMDNTHGPYENILDYTQFSLRHLEGSLSTLLATLQAVSPERIKQLQDNVHKVWQRFRFVGLNSIDALSQDRLRDKAADAKSRGGQAPHPGSEFALSHQEDAFDTLMQFLHMRIPHTRGPGRRQMAAGVAVAAGGTDGTAAGGAGGSAAAGGTDVAAAAAPVLAATAPADLAVGALPHDPTRLDMEAASLAATYAASAKGVAEAKEKHRLIDDEERAAWVAEQTAKAKVRQEETDKATREAAATTRAAVAATAAAAAAQADGLRAAASAKGAAAAAAATAEAKAAREAEGLRAVATATEAAAALAKATSGATPAVAVEAAAPAKGEQRAGLPRSAGATGPASGTATGGTAAAGGTMKRGKGGGAPAAHDQVGLPGGAPEGHQTDDQRRAFLYNFLSRDQMMYSGIYALCLLVVLLGVALVLVLRYPWMGHMLRHDVRASPWGAGGMRTKRT